MPDSSFHGAHDMDR